MRHPYAREASLVALTAILACSSPGPRPDEAPRAVAGGDSLIQYPPRLFDRGVGGDVMLRVFVDSTGHLRPESSRVAVSSGSRALDSAALKGVERLHYTPAQRGGVPVAATFLQPVEFRHPNASAH
ncbi:MAG TPA: energy transducer TonB [Gemmatimonadales bacterium]|nr:energy transducer TonB [Gemmatimonadales bacterium]